MECELSKTVCNFAAILHINPVCLMKKLYCYAFLLSLICTSAFSSLQAQEVDYKYHSVFIYNFTRYVKWPESSLGNEFVIGVLGNSGITAHLEKMAQTKTVNGKSIVVKTFKNAEQVSGCQMIFVSETKSRELSALRNQLAGQATLIISEKPGMAKEGSMINFIIHNGRWNFELNQASTDLHQLKVSTELSKFAHKIYSEI
jgi:hypothetical protein